jgi:hypothetical protein
MANTIFNITGNTQNAANIENMEVYLDLDTVSKPDTQNQSYRL